ncbi:hypothetical protein FVF58_36590 [Paraburkholderia panacisoli]|uniref:Uncharacterized protein n=1 Tax=Paraburkholderia panacisoli TaxID=2603818 RepID=A0A5B0GL63_9BURK|nr:hypothetical protein [Paraburkholderia panacisoli]KAA1003565.1 hypothetical protein FVF58_36590 [Paraburkholderia panacisoli]
MIFDHSGSSAEGASERWLTFVAPRESMKKKNRLSFSQMRIQIDDESMTIRQAAGRYFRSPDDELDDDDDDGPGFWTRVLSYAFKVLFYLSSEQPRITQDNAYSNAPRNFSGLGKRKKNERLQEIEQLYDRYIVWPEVLPSLHQRGAAHTDTGEGGELSPHWRRGHFRVQRHGPGLSMRRVVFIMPIIVRADLLNPDGVHRQAVEKWTEILPRSSEPGTDH